MKVIDDFLPSIEFTEIQKLMMDFGFPWYYNDCVTKADDNSEFQFVHMFYSPLGGVVSDYPRWREILKPYCDHLVRTAILRIKANLNVKQKSFIERELHQDFDVPCKTAIAYINDNNGYTLFEDGTKVHSKANRVVIFDSHIRHAGVPCTDKNRRVVINFNYL